MYLKDVISFLEARDPDILVPHGFADPIYWFGKPDSVGFTPARNVTIGSMLAHAQAARRSEKIGYYSANKQAFVQQEVARVHYGEEPLGLALLSYMVGEVPT